ncbi:MAG TPA: MFS transporter [Anaerolineaceae bacterium]|nr:MFS transporter [Anaerolineaceae bacterium]HQH35359.1 MFS transporter [Anaerolineaceae bacterium]HQJ03868.1 MFS transporter [Anaerolineaceae bacterium]
MSELPPSKIKPPSIRQLPRNVWAVGFTSLFMDISSEMVINILPLFLANVLGVQTSIIGLIDGIAEATASLLKMFSGWLSDRLGARKWLAVAGYGLSAVVKPFFYLANTWGLVAGVRWADRIGKGIRTAPRDALVADSVTKEIRGLAFGFHRAMDTAGALIGILVAALVVWLAQKNQLALSRSTFQVIVLISLVPAFLAVLSLVIGARDVAVTGKRAAPKISLRSMGKPFIVFLVIVGIFTLGNSADAFLVLRAQNLGVSVTGILIMLAIFNLIYTLVSTPAGSLSDRIGRRRLIIGGWLIYGLIYFGFALAKSAWQVWLLYAAYGLYYGLAYGSANAMVADLVPDHLRGTAYGTYNAVIGLLAFPSSLIAGILWQGVGSWSGWGPSAPFFFGGTLALVAALFMLFWMPKTRPDSQME